MLFPAIISLFGAYLLMDDKKTYAVGGSTLLANNGLKEVKPNKYLYHTSNPIFRDKISKEGLTPKGKSESWLSDTKIYGEVIFAINGKKEKIWDSTYDDDVYVIDTTNLNNKWYRDPNFDDKIHIITFDKIPLNAIKLIHEGTGESTQ